MAYYVHRETLKDMRGLAETITKRIPYAKSLDERNEYIELVRKVNTHQYTIELYNALEEIVYHDKY